MTELHSIEIWVENLGEVAEVFRSQFGFQISPLTVDSGGQYKSCCLYVGGELLELKQGLSPSGFISSRVKKHGDGISNVTLSSHNLDFVHTQALRNDVHVKPIGQDLYLDLFGDGTIIHTITTKNETVNFSTLDAKTSDIALSAIDHIAYCVPYGLMDRVVNLYKNLFSMEQITADGNKYVGNKEHGMRSEVLRASSGLTFVFTAPLAANSSGQIQQFLNSNFGAGVQHIAFRCDDIITVTKTLSSRGVKFLPIVKQQLSESKRRLGKSRLDWEKLLQLEVLVDSDKDGLLFQKFTTEVSNNGSFFFEFIERNGAKGFGVNNVKALFDAMEMATL